jgi:hypothetical protein
MSEINATDARINAMQAEIDRLKTNPKNYDLTSICNGCGVVVPAGERCERHPTEVINHFRAATDSEHAETRAPLVLVKQT